MGIHKTKRFFQLVALKSIKLLNAPQKSHVHHNEYEKECIAVCKALMHKEDSTLLMSPISGKRYIKSHDEQLFIIIDNQQVTIVNHQYSYTIDIWGKPLDRIVKNFDIEIEKRREIMEMEIRSNVKHSLSNIYNTLSNETNK
jgi:hypothetical protein